MKKIILVLFLTAIVLNLFSQAPESFNYQAVLRDVSGQAITEQAVGIQVTILQNSTPVYVEQFTPTTNKYGLITIDIGTGSVQSGVFADIDWSSGPYFIKLEVDEAGGTTYVEMGTSQLLSVPYALHAKTSGDAFSGDYNDLANMPTSNAIDSAYFARLLAADEDYIDFGTFENFTNSSDWSIIESVMMPAGTGADGGWHFFRGLGWEDKEGDVAISISTSGIQAWVQKGGWKSVYHTTALLEETWYEICLQYDATNQTLTLFVDGSQTDQISSVLPQDDSGNTNKMFWGGQDVLPEDNEGSLYSESSIVFASQQWFQRLLTQEEIENYEGYIEDETGLFFEAGIGETGVSDLSGNGHDGTNGNTPEFLVQYYEYGTQFNDPVKIEDEVTINGDLNVNGSVLGVQYYEIQSTAEEDLLSSGLAHLGTVDVNNYGIGAALYIASDGNYEEADADAAATMPCVGLAAEEGTGEKGVLLHGFIRNDAWSFTPGAPVYVSPTAGELTQTIPSTAGQQVQVVGYASASNILYFNPDFTIIELK